MPGAGQKRIGSATLPPPNIFLKKMTKQLSASVEDTVHFRPTKHMYMKKTKLVIYDKCCGQPL